MVSLNYSSSSIIIYKVLTYFFALGILQACSQTQGGSEGEEIDHFIASNNGTVQSPHPPPKNSSILLVAHIANSDTIESSASDSVERDGAEDLESSGSFESKSNTSLLASNVFRSYIPPVQGKIPPKSKEDSVARMDWGGDCLAKDWDRCSKVTKWPGHNCLKLSPLCLTNGWTVNKCHLLCMSKCNRKLLSNYDLIIQRQGEC